MVPPKNSVLHSGFPAPDAQLGRQLKYKQVETEVRKLAETLPVGAKMPPERELAIAYACSVLTVRRGVEVLVKEGIIDRRIGSGTFVIRRSEKSTAPDRMLGVLVYQQSDAYAYRVLRGVAHAALQQSIEPRSVWLKSFDSEAKVQIDTLRREGCTAFTIPWFPPAMVDEVQAFLRAVGVPISLPQLVPGFENYCFEAPEIFGRNTGKVAELLCTYFTLLGNERVALLGPDIAHDPILNQELMAYTRAMSRAQQPVTCCLVPPNTEAMDTLAKRWSDYRGKLAIISYDDEHALRFMTAMHKIGLSAPRDFRIVGHNNIDASRYSDPPLSSMAQDFDYVAGRLIRSALALSDGRVEQATEIPASQLVVRESCGGAASLNDTIRSQLPGLEFSVEGVVPVAQEN